MNDQPTMTIDQVLEDFAGAENIVPRASMQWALDNWPVAAPRCLELLSRFADGIDRTEGTETALLFVSRLLAEQAEPGAFRHLCRLLREDDAAPFLAADAISSTLSQILISTFDGDAALLCAVAEDEAVDEFVRHAAITAVGYLTRTGRIPEADTRDWLRHLVSAMQPQGKNFVWIGWVECVAALGLADFVPDAQLLFERGFVEPVTFGDFESQLQQTRDDPDRMALFAVKELAPFTGGIDELAQWYDLSGQTLVDESWDVQEVGNFPRQAWTSSGGGRNPWRNIGRNDACPCGSGKKFKKCCLGMPEDKRPVPYAARGA